MFGCTLAGSDVHKFITFQHLAKMCLEMSLVQRCAGLDFAMERTVTKSTVSAVERVLHVSLARILSPQNHAVQFALWDSAQQPFGISIVAKRVRHVGRNIILHSSKVCTCYLWYYSESLHSTLT